MTATNTGRRVALLGVLALMFALVPMSASALEGDVALDYELSPFSDASDHLQSAALISRQAFDSADNILLATTDDFADALASGSLQDDSPLYFTDGSVEELHVEEVTRLGASTVTILGGVNAVSQDVEDTLTDAGLTVERLAGETRIETAIAVAEANFASQGDTPTDTVILARAFASDSDTDTAPSDPTQAFADSLAAGGWAADADVPVLLTETSVLTGNTAAYLESISDTVSNVIIVGGESAVSGDVESEVEDLGFEVDRVGGENRFGTAVAIAEARYDTATEVATVIFVEGQGPTAYIDGFASASLSAAQDAPILLTNQGNIPPETAAWIEDANGFAQFAPVDPDDIAAHLTLGVTNEQEIADALGLDLVRYFLSPAGATAVGVITEVDTLTDTYVFESIDSPLPIVVLYDTGNDDFSVNGDEGATPEAFEEAIAAGDYIAYYAPELDEDGDIIEGSRLNQRHDLVTDSFFDPLDDGEAEG